MKRVILFIFTLITLDTCPLLGVPSREIPLQEDAREREILNKLGNFVASFAHLAATEPGASNSNELANMCQQLFSLISTATLDRKQIASLLLTPQGKEKVAKIIKKRSIKIKN